MLFYRDRATTNRDNVRAFLSFLFLSLNEDLLTKPGSEEETLVLLTHMKVSLLLLFFLVHSKIYFGS